MKTCLIWHTLSLETETKVRTHIKPVLLWHFYTLTFPIEMKYFLKQFEGEWKFFTLRYFLHKTLVKHKFIHDKPIFSHEICVHMKIFKGKIVGKLFPGEFIAVSEFNMEASDCVKVFLKNMLTKWDKVSMLCGD